MNNFDREYESHMATWGPHCGAPKSVYAGHLKVLIDAAIQAEREACARIADEYQQESIAGAVSNACKLIAEQIRARGSKEARVDVR